MTVSPWPTLMIESLPSLQIESLNSRMSFRVHMDAATMSTPKSRKTGFIYLNFLHKKRKWNTQINYTFLLIATSFRDIITPF